MSKIIGGMMNPALWPFSAMVISHPGGEMEQFPPPNTLDPRRLILWMPGAKIVNHQGEEVACLISDHKEDDSDC